MNAQELEKYLPLEKPWPLFWSFLKEAQPIK